MDIVIRNLLLNALKFTDEGGEVTIRYTDNQGNATISVSDTGVGMTAEQLDKLFKINTHFTTPGTRNEKGAGLGLLLCKEFVEANRGSVAVTSEPGNGSVFSVTLPKEKWLKNTSDKNGFVFSTDPNFRFEAEENEIRDTLAPAQQTLRILLDKKQRAGKAVTLVTGFIGKEEDLEQLGKQLKTFVVPADRSKTVKPLFRAISAIKYCNGC